jgi:hypothetical protein
MGGRTFTNLALAGGALVAYIVLVGSCWSGPLLWLRWGSVVLASLLTGVVTTVIAARKGRQGALVGWFIGGCALPFIALAAVLIARPPLDLAQQETGQA